MNGKIAGIVVVVVLIIAGIWYLSSQNAPATTTVGQTPSTGSQMAPATSTPTASGVTVTYSSNGFSPANVSISAGTLVTFVNNGSEGMWIASDPHPSHQGYDGTTRSQHCAQNYSGPAPFDECASVPPGGSWSFTFTKVGAWGYHNHADATNAGHVTVTASTGTFP